MEKLFKTIEIIIMVMIVSIGISSIIVGVIFKTWMCFVPTGLCLLLSYVVYLEGNPSV